MRTHSCSSSQRGGAAVEFGIVLALLVTLLAGIFGFGRAFWYYDALTKATRDAARTMSVNAKASIASQGVPAARQTVVDAATSAGIDNFSSANVSVSCLDKNLNDSSCTDGTAPGAIRVEIVNYTLSVGQYLPFVIGSATSYSTPLAPRTTMRYML
ncbi:TadE/TadG family type IV pilus assembly protein [Janthinobacterium sp. 1_2014MBL_MicDiv]|uniref:TadE/TadG family type IV pilus assembly protein n=1 Tax=Janthinobacterium sp. 1_2014MBL_MicDiv TaxID=1644131 RepID=UPI0008F4B7D5|nr:TadE family protein [Janthinobacterium sp. 1_2014MBL_MicDiv]APA67294.1 pilus assembly protein TadE [Janthinobacterium sp. 1_2014MBL_MicDiv]